MRSIQARAHGWQGPGAFQNVGAGKAREMATEGTRAVPARRALFDSAFNKMRAVK